MSPALISNSTFNNLKIGITGANGSLGKSLTKKLKEKGAFVIGLTHKNEYSKETSKECPNKWVTWSCGKEDLLFKVFSDLDILILNHGINPQGLQGAKNITESLEVNALSTWRMMQIFEKIALEENSKRTRKEIWVNTSEAEIQIALSPLYEISKRLIGAIVSLRQNKLNRKEKELLIIRKLVLGPFYSDLNPLGIMNADYVASKILKKQKLESYLIIVTPNPVTHLAMPLIEYLRKMYYNLTSNISNNK